MLRRARESGEGGRSIDGNECEGIHSGIARVGVGMLDGSRERGKEALLVNNARGILSRTI